jgi:tRNA A-37 threonylcarbamoyl transferase component Bud32
MTLTVGENVGPYRIVEQLGQGGMATVFKAYHAALDRYVAIKVMHPAFKEDPTFLARFQREARVVARLEHPNIVPVYDYAEYNGAPYLVMKFVEGETLKAKLARGPLSLAEAVQIVEAVGTGLDYAHKQGILHRDIKPSNVMLAADGSVYLADFGLARIAQAGESTLSSDSLLGTPHYMSPEQARGVKELDAGTDVYSLGVVIYELVVGRLPFSADTPFAIIHDHIYTPLPMPHDVNPNVPEAIERVLLKALAKERTDRYPDVAAMVAAFRDAAVTADRASTALPHAVPVAPSAVTPTAATVKGAAPEAVGTVVAPTGLPTAAPLPAAQQGFQFQWWYALIAVVVVGACLFGLFAVNRFRNRAQRQPTAVATAVALTPAGASGQLPPARTPPPVAPTSDQVARTPPPPPSGGDVKALLAEAERAFAEKHVDDATALLDKAVAVNPDDLGVRLAAGDMALGNGLTLHALDKYYLPGVALAQPPLEPVEQEIRSHAGLAFYMLAAEPDPGLEQYLLEQSKNYPEQDMTRLVVQRFRIFHDQGDAARDELLALIRDNQRNPAAYLIMGDFFLSIGQPAEAGANYKLAQELDAPAPLWIRMEAECNLRRIRDEKVRAKPERSCNDPAVLLQGKP